MSLHVFDTPRQAPGYCVTGFELPPATFEHWQKLLAVLSRLSRVDVAMLGRLRGAEMEVIAIAPQSDSPFQLGQRVELEGSGLYCERVVSTREKLYVRDALASSQWAANPVAQAGFVSYLGYPLLLPNGEVFGTLCVLGRHVNAFSSDVEKLMDTFSALMMSQLKNLIWSSSHCLDCQQGWQCQRLHHQADV